MSLYERTFRFMLFLFRKVYLEASIITFFFFIVSLAFKIRTLQLIALISFVSVSYVIPILFITLLGILALLEPEDGGTEDE